MKYCLIWGKMVWYIVECKLSKIITSPYSGKEQYTFVDGNIIKHFEQLDSSLNGILGSEAPNFYTEEYSFAEHDSLEELLAAHFEVFL